MTDNRSTTPYDSENVPQASCDCCGKRAKLTFSVSFGIDTWACESCRSGRRACVTDAPVRHASDVEAFLDEEWNRLRQEKTRADADSREEEDVI